MQHYLRTSLIVLQSVHQDDKARFFPSCLPRTRKLETRCLLDSNSPDGTTPRCWTRCNAFRMTRSRRLQAQNAVAFHRHDLRRKLARLIRLSHWTRYSWSLGTVSLWIKRMSSIITSYHTDSVTFQKCVRSVGVSIIENILLSRLIERSTFKGGILVLWSKIKGLNEIAAAHFKQAY